MPICFDYSHRQVCGMYDTLWDAINLINEVGETQPAIDQELCEALAKNCRQYKKGV